MCIVFRTLRGRTQGVSISDHAPGVPHHYGVFRHIARDDRPCAQALPDPMVTPGRIMTRAPIQTSSRMVTGRIALKPCLIIGMSVREVQWSLVKIITSG